ncbi:MAG: DUF721 domain-containing protein [Actinomycetota bacterium]
MSGERRRDRGWEPLHRPTAPTPVRDALDHLASTMGLASIDGINRLFLAWGDVVGDDLAAKCSPKRLSDGVLVVEAVDRQWAAELSWMTDLIVERCTDALGPDTVLEARIVTPRIV